MSAGLRRPGRGSAGGRRRLIFVAISLLAAVAWVAAPRGAAAASSVTPVGLTLGFDDPPVLELRRPLDVTTALSHAHTAGASVWRTFLSWAAVAPTRPPSLAEAADPSWSGYRWAAFDTTLREIAAAGMSPLVALADAPAWAEGPKRPSRAVAPAGTWRPSPAWLGAFATALAKRYSGTFVDATESATPLPTVRDWEAWNEPNLTVSLAPQWTRSGGRWRPASPGVYRAMLNAFYKGLKAAAPNDVVAAGTTAPFGDPAGGQRMQPAYFWRQLLCVTDEAKPRTTGCKAHVYFDAISHHPYPIGPPNRPAINADDIVVPDLWKITKLIPVAMRAGTIVPKGPKPLWITEISWDSYPDPEGLSLAQQAQYLEGAFYVLWKQGARLIAWWYVRDDPPIPSYADTYQSGIYLRGPTPAQDTPKPSYTAYRFPFTAYRTNGVARLWGIAPVSGSVEIEVREPSGWVKQATLNAGASRIFQANLVVGRGTQLRAVSGTSASLTWTVS